MTGRWGSTTAWRGTSRLPERGSDSRCCQLLTHTSGIPPEGDDAGQSPYSAEFEELILANLAKSFTPDEILAFVRDRPLDFEPGTGVQYSNINTILLADRWSRP